MLSKTILRPLELSDKQALASLANNKKIWNNLRDYIPYPYSENDAEFFIEQTKREDPRQNFAIEHKGALCGVIGLLIQNDVYRKTAEIGYWLGEPYWGKGIATKAVQLIVDYGFKELHLLRIYSGVFEYNLASMKVLQKSGFIKEAIFKKAIFKNGKVYDEHRFCLLNER